MNTDLTNAAVERLTAQLGEALFNQPGLDLIEIANRCNKMAARSGGALLPETPLTGRILTVDEFKAPSAPFKNKPEAVRLRDELRERAEFEAWAQSAGIDVSLSLFNEDSYKQTPAKFAWMAWQAALAATGKQQVGEVQGDGLDVEQLKNLVSSVHRTVSLGHQRGPHAYSGEDFGRYLAEAARDCRQIMGLLDALAARQPVGQEPLCSGGFVIGNGSGEKYMAWGQVGPEWVADRSAALWLVRRADAEALAAENEDAWLILPVERCDLPPNGWACTLASGHEGPCPTIAAPLAQAVDLRQFRKLADYWDRITQDKDIKAKDRELVAMYDKALNKCVRELRALIYGQAVQS